MSYAQLRDLGGGVLILHATYSPELTEELKRRLPPSGRAWDRAARGWRIDCQYGQMVSDLCAAFLGVTPTVPSASVAVGRAPRETRLLEVRYLGKGRHRGGSEWAASAWVRSPQPRVPVQVRGTGGWDTTITLQALRRFYEVSYQLRDPGDDDDEQESAGAAAPVVVTLYDTLGVPADADDAALMHGFRVMARQWHPDVCKEPDAKERFIAIKDAYDTLKDPAARRRYNRGLLLEQQAAASALQFSASPATPLAAIGIGQYGWSPPQRSGFFLVSGRPAISGFRATHILAVEDITDAEGRVLVSSWPQGGDDFVEQWAPLEPEH